MEGKKKQEKPPVSLIPVENFRPVGISLAFLPSLGVSPPPFIYHGDIKDPSPWKHLSSKDFLHYGFTSCTEVLALCFETGAWR